MTVWYSPSLKNFIVEIRQKIGHFYEMEKGIVGPLNKPFKKTGWIKIGKL